MKNLLKIILVFTLTCGIAGAIGIEWNVTGLTLNGQLANTTGKGGTLTPNYGTQLDRFVLQLVYVGNAVDLFDEDGHYKTMTVVQTGTIPPFGGEQVGVVQGSTSVTAAGTYVLLLYNNYGGYWALSNTSDGATPLASSFTLTGAESEIATQDFFMTGINGAAYKGALVPEPSTAALALAGLAMLFRRKRV